MQQLIFHQNSQSKVQTLNGARRICLPSCSQASHLHAGPSPWSVGNVCEVRTRIDVSQRISSMPLVLAPLPTSPQQNTDRPTGGRRINITYQKVCSKKCPKNSDLKMKPGNFHSVEWGLPPETQVHEDSKLHISQSSSEASPLNTCIQRSCYDISY